MCSVLCSLALSFGVSAAFADEKRSGTDKFVDNLMEKIPYSKTLKYTWDVMDGDVDLVGVKNLRADVSNRGLKYQSDTLPFIGKLEDARLTAEMGKDNNLIYESSRLPLVGRVDGMEFRTSVGDDSAISIRYKIAFP